VCLDCCRVCAVCDAHRPFAVASLGCFEWQPLALRYCSRFSPSPCRVLRLQRALKRHERSRILSASVACQYIGEWREKSSSVLWGCKCAGTDWRTCRRLLRCTHTSCNQASAPLPLMKPSSQLQTNYCAPTGTPAHSLPFPLLPHLLHHFASVSRRCPAHLQRRGCRCATSP
jgi:hypothetical protein